MDRRYQLTLEIALVGLVFIEHAERDFVRGENGLTRRVRDIGDVALNLAGLQVRVGSRNHKAGVSGRADANLVAWRGRAIDEPLADLA